MSGIYVLHVLTGRESEIAGQLRRRGYTAMVLTELRQERSGGEWRTEERVLMRGYVFAELDYTATDYYTIKTIPGVIRFLGADNPMPLPPKEEALIRMAHNDGGQLPPLQLIIGLDGKARLAGKWAEHPGARLLSVDRHRRRAGIRVTIGGEPHYLWLSADITH